MDLKQKINIIYDNIQFSSVHHELFYNHSGFTNFGLWGPSTKNGEQACKNLTDKILEPIEKKEGKILDVASGQGGTTSRLLKYYPPENITAINISEKQLLHAEKNAPGCTFRLMSATELDFPDATFDNIMCVEAAFHFYTREKFFHECLRVLKPGGFLVMSDVIFRFKFIWKIWIKMGSTYPPENNICTAEYEDLLLNIGFKNILLKDIYNITYKPFRRKFIIAGFKNYLNLKLWPSIFFDRIPIPLVPIIMYTPWFKEYLLVAAQKPK